MADTDSSEEVFLTIKYSTQSRVDSEPYDSEEFILTVNADIIASSGKDNSSTKFGELLFYIIRISQAVRRNESLYSVFDTSQETMDVGEAIFDSSFSEFKKPIAQRYEDTFPWGDLLLLHRLEIHPLARGQNIGLFVLDRAIQDWSSGCSLVVMKPFPLQFENNARKMTSWDELQLGNFPKKKSEAYGPLIAYYQKLGFEKLGRTEYYGLSCIENRPNLQDLGLSDKFKIPRNLKEQNFWKNRA